MEIMENKPCRKISIVSLVLDYIRLEISQIYLGLALSSEDHGKVFCSTDLFVFYFRWF